MEILFAHAGARLVGLDPADLEHYHRIRNTLYHDGTGLSVDDQYLAAYRRIATLLLQNLFGVTVQKFRAAAPSQMERLILNWNRIEATFKRRMLESGADDHGTYKWEAAIDAGVLSREGVELLTALRMARNRIVHSTSIKPDEVAHWAAQSELLLAMLGSAGAV